MLLKQSADTPAGNANAVGATGGHSRRPNEDRPQGSSSSNASGKAPDAAAADDSSHADDSNGQGRNKTENGDDKRPQRPDPARPPKRAERGNDGAPAGRRPRLFAALLSPEAAAALDLQTVAFDKADAPTVTYNVSLLMKPAKEPEEVEGGGTVNSTRIILGFPAFTTSLHYDPTVSVENPTNVGYTAGNATVTAAAATGGAAPRAGTAPLAAGAMLGAALLMVLL